MIFKKTWWGLQAVSVTVLLIFIVAIVDKIFGYVSLAPVICVAFLFIASTFFQPFQVMICWLICWVFVAFSLRFLQPFNADSVVDTGRFWVRIGTFGITGALAIGLSLYRTRLTTLLDNLLVVFSKIPFPIIVSDYSGQIRVVTEQAAARLGRNISDVEGNYFQALVGTHLAEEIADNWYEKWLEGTEESTFDVILQFEGCREQNSRLCRIGVGKNAFLITVLI